MCPLTKAISRFFVYKVIDMEYKFKILSSTFISGSFGNVSRRDGQALSPHGEKTYKDLNYLNDAYKRGIIESQG